MDSCRDRAKKCLSTEDEPTEKEVLSHLEDEEGEIFEGPDVGYLLGIQTLINLFSNIDNQQDFDEIKSQNQSLQMESSLVTDESSDLRQIQDHNEESSAGWVSARKRFTTPEARSHSN